METKQKQLNRTAISAEVQEKLMTPKDFRNLPLNNKIGKDPTSLMEALKSKNNWSDPDEYGLVSPEACAGLSITWSNEYLHFNNLI